MKTILIAGGKGLIGTKLTSLLNAKGFSVRILTRNPMKSDEFKWDPSNRDIDSKALEDISVLINLCGEGIADKRWTDKRKQELHDSRIETTNFLYSLKDQLPKLETYISASGISCYGFEDQNKYYTESDSYGLDYLSQLVKDWEIAADQFSEICRVVKMRTSVVLSEDGGAFPKLLKPIQFGVGSPLGTGKQIMPWIHIDDLVSLFEFAIENKIDGPINALAENISNEEITKSIAKHLNKKILLPNVPSFVLKLMLGDMSVILLEGVHVSNQKLKNHNFKFQFPEFSEAIKTLI